MQLDIEDADECSIQTFLIAYHNGKTFQFYTGSTKTPIKFTIETQRITEHRIESIFLTKFMRIVPISWKSRPCAAIMFYGCFEKKIFSAFYKMGANDRATDDDNKRHNVVQDYNCDGNETSLLDCDRARKNDSATRTFVINTSVCDPRYRLHGSGAHNQGYLQRWNGNKWANVDGNLGNSSKTDPTKFLHWNLFNNWSMVSNDWMCHELGMEGYSSVAETVISRNDIVKVMAKSGRIHINAVDGKLMDYSASNILFSRNAREMPYISRAWCPSRLDDYVIVELNGMFQIRKLSLVLLSLNGTKHLQLGVSRGLFRLQIQRSLDNIIWINVQNQDLVYETKDYEIFVTFLQIVKAKYIRMGLLKYPSSKTCVFLKTYGSYLSHKWQTKESCVQPLGMADGRITDDEITASSILNYKYRPYYGRLGFGLDRNLNKGWACLCMDDAQVAAHWIQIDLRWKVLLRGIVTQGSPFGDYYVKSYKVAYSNGYDVWHFIKANDESEMIFHANTNSKTKVGNHLPHPLHAVYVRIYPWTYHNYIVMRLELLGCYVLELKENLQNLAAHVNPTAKDTSLLLSSADEYSPPGSEYDYWLVDSSSANCEKSERLCKLGGGKLASKLFQNQSYVMALVQHYKNQYSVSSDFVTALTNHLITDIYEANGQILQPLFWEGSQPDAILEHHVLLSMAGKVHGSHCVPSLGLCERSNKVAKIRTNYCPEGYSAISTGCLKVVAGSLANSCQDLLEYCSSQGAAAAYTSDTSMAIDYIKKHGATTFQVCNNDMETCLSSNGQYVPISDCTEPRLVCRRAPDSPSVSLRATYSSSSFLPSNPPWMANPETCGAWCFHPLDRDRWLEVDLQDLQYVDTISVFLPSDACRNPLMKPIVENATGKISHRALKPMHIFFSTYIGNLRPMPHKRLELHSDGSWRWVLSTPMVGRFVKIYFDVPHEGAPKCVEVNVLGNHWNPVPSEWEDYFILIPKNSSGLMIMDEFKNISLSRCLYLCLKQQHSVCCRAVTHQYQECKLYSRVTGENASLDVNYTYVLKKNHLINPSSLSSITFQRHRKVHVQVALVPGSELFGCIEDSNIQNINPNYENSTTTPWECTADCFRKGYDNAILKFGGYCWCGDVKYAALGPQKTEPSRNLPCNVACPREKSVACGGFGYSLVYQKPVRCFHGLMRQLDGNFYCLRSTRAHFSQAYHLCRTDTSYEELLSPLQSKALFEFIKEWISNLRNIMYVSDKSPVSYLSIWVGRVENIRKSIPKWIHWSSKSRGVDMNHNSCVQLNMYTTDTMEGFIGDLDVVDCKTENYFICDLGSCDGKGYCSGSNIARDITKDSLQRIQFVEVSKPITWHESRETCSQRGMDLCLSDDICKDRAFIFAGKLTKIFKSSGRFIVAVRDSLQNAISINNEDPSRCVPFGNSQGNLQGIFCCAKYEEAPPSSVYDRPVIPLTSLKPIKLGIKTTATMVKMRWITDDEKICCQNCYIAEPTYSSLGATEFYEISPGVEGIQHSVSFEMVKAQGYYLRYCTKDNDNSHQIIAEHWKNDERGLFWKISLEDCVQYRSASMATFYISVGDAVELKNESDTESSCLSTWKELSRFELDPSLLSWQSARDFCNRKGQNLCDIKAICEDAVSNAMTGIWFPTWRHEDNWIRSKHCLDHSKEFGVAFWSRERGTFGENLNSESSFSWRGPLLCCDTAEYLIDNIEDPPLQIEVFPTLTFSADISNAAYAVEYGYVDILSFDVGPGSPQAMFASLDQDGISAEMLLENATEEFCFKISKSKGYYAYALDNHSCLGITEDSFIECLSEIHESQGEAKLVKIEYNEVEVSRVADELPTSGLPVAVGQSLEQSLFSFSISIWYQEYDNKIEMQLLKVHSSDEPFLLITKLSKGKGFIVFLCGKEMLFNSLQWKWKKYTWHNLAVHLREVQGLSVYVDGQLISEYAGRNVLQCHIPKGCMFYLGNVSYENGANEKPSVILDVWNTSLAESQIRTHYLSENFFGNFISSLATSIRGLSKHQFLVANSFLQLSRWISEGNTAFNIMILQLGNQNFKEVLLASSSLGTWAEANDANYYMKQCLFGSSSHYNRMSRNCDKINGFMPVQSHEYISFKFIPKYLDIFQYLTITTFGNGSYGLQSASDATNGFYLYHKPDMIYAISQSAAHRNNTVGPEVLFLEHNLGHWRLQGGSCDEILPEDFSGSEWDRAHSYDLPRRCLEAMWKEVGCTVPLYSYGSFFDLIAEQWRRRSQHGGLRKIHIASLMKYAYFKAHSGDRRFYSVCFGGYTIRLLRISQKLETTVFVSPSENLNSGMLQFYDENLGWGGVCMKRLIDLKFADVACRQLGFVKANAVDYASLKEPIMVTLQNPLCKGNEDSLEHCLKRPAMYCDWSQVVHITCSRDHKECRDGWTQLFDSQCVSYVSGIKPKMFRNAEKECKRRGGMLPEIQSQLLSSMLRIFLQKHKLKIWLGARMSESTFRWLASGNAIQNFAISGDATNECVCFPANGNWFKDTCKKGHDVVCLKSSLCPDGFDGPMCEYASCPVQNLPSCTITCTSNILAINSECKYQCVDGKKLVGSTLRKCVVSLQFGPMWNGVDPVCDENIGINATTVCEKHAPCANGICKATSLDTYNCTCYDGFGGFNCQLKKNKFDQLPNINVDPCSINFCLNFGTCLRMGATNFKCICLPGYSGRLCDAFTHNACISNSCMNGGTCIETGFRSFTCRCFHGYVGLTCEVVQASVGPMKCAFPFYYQGEQYNDCTDAGIKKYDSLGCWKITPFLFDEINSISTAEISMKEFEIACYEASNSRGLAGFSISKYDANYTCASSSDILLQYPRHGKSQSCLSNTNRSASIYKISHGSSDAKWCSLDSFYSGRWVSCSRDFYAMLLRPDPIMEASYARMSCFERRSSFQNDGRKISKNTSYILMHVTKMLSCALYGQSALTVANSSNLMHFIMEHGNISCNSLVVGGHLYSNKKCRLHYSQVKSPIMCKMDRENVTYCLRNFTRQYIPCETDWGGVGYSLLTTVGGTSPGKACHFPFHSQNENIFSCSLGWCYTDKNQTNWTYCTQDDCAPYPRPQMSVEDTNFRETNMKGKNLCSDISHLFYGGHLTDYSCEKACDHDPKCLGYVFVSQYEAFYFDGKILSSHDTMASYDESSEACESMGGKLLEIKDADLYNFLNINMLTLDEKHYWIKTENCALFVNNKHSFDSELWLRSEPCNELHAFLCEMDDHDGIIESYRLGKTSSMIGYCFGIDKFEDCNQINFSENSAVHGELLWGWKRKCTSSHRMDQFLAGEWTQWYNHDKPTGGGDNESLLNLRKIFPDLCDKPLAADVRFADNNSVVSEKKYNLDFGKDIGLICNNMPGSQCVDYKIRFFCRSSETLILPTEPSTGYRWKIYETELTWANAREVCKSTGGKLAVVNSIERDRYLKKLLKRHNTCCAAYIGLKTDMTGWIDGSFVRYHQLRELDPEVSKCTAISHTDFLSWQSIDCMTERPFICQYPPKSNNIDGQFETITNGLKVKAVNYSNSLVKIFPIQDVHECMLQCTENKGMNFDCRGILFNGSICYVLENTDSMIFTQSKSGFEFMARKKINGIAQHHIRVESAGFLDGDDCVIEVNGVSFPSEDRGFCVVVINSGSQQITSKTFDTLNNITEANSMMEFLNEIPDGSIVVIAISHTIVMTRELNFFLGNLGANEMECSLPGHHTSWALVAQKVNPADKLPHWTKCEYSPPGHGNVTLEVNAGTRICGLSMLNYLGSIYVGLHNVGERAHSEKSILHTDKQENYCFVLLSEGHLTLDIDLTVASNISLISLDLFSDSVTIDDSFGEVMISYGTRLSNLMEVSLEIAQAQLYHLFDVPIIAQYINITMPYVVQELELEYADLCLKFDFHGCPLGYTALNKFPHGFYPPITEEGDDNIGEDAITVRCQP